MKPGRVKNVVQVAVENVDPVAMEIVVEADMGVAEADVTSPIPLSDHIESCPGCPTIRGVIVDVPRNLRAFP